MDTVGDAALEATLANGLVAIEDHGYAIVPGVLTGDVLEATRAALYRAAASDRARGREQKFLLDYEHDSTNQRVWNVLSRDALFEDVAFHPLAIGFLKAVVGWPALLSNVSANITGPGGGEMALHADQMFVPPPWPARPQGLNVAWCLDDFTAENGATRIVPGSHKLNRMPTAEEAGLETVALEAPAGSMIVFESRLWHKTGRNSTSSQRRAGIFSWYSASIYRTQENWFLSLKPEIRQFANEEALILLGYKTVGFGVVNGIPPA